MTQTTRAPQAVAQAVQNAVQTFVAAIDGQAIVLSEQLFITQPDKLNLNQNNRAIEQRGSVLDCFSETISHLATAQPGRPLTTSNLWFIRQQLLRGAVYPEDANMAAAQVLSSTPMLKFNTPSTLAVLEIHLTDHGLFIHHVAHLALALTLVEHTHGFMRKGMPFTLAENMVQNDALDHVRPSFIPMLNSRIPQVYADGQHSPWRPCYPALLVQAAARQHISPTIITLSFIRQSVPQESHRLGPLMSGIVTCESLQSQYSAVIDALRLFPRLTRISLLFQTPDIGFLEDKDLQDARE
ncbi:unnamed protein product [Fusarium graminearum]|nr:unnamed protein product [Fusarium graminearum]